MTVLTSILAFVVAIGLLVTVHEFGHFIVARMAGVKVLRFSIGFGPALLRWGKHDGETEYVIAAFPLGGYVKMLDEREGDVATSERHRAFNIQPVRKRLAIVLAGPAFNFLFAVLAYWFVFMAGVPGLKPVVGEVAPSSVAAQAGFETEDQIVAVNGRATPTWNAAAIALLEAVLEGDATRVTVARRSGHEEELSFRIENARALTEPGALLPGLGLSEWMPPMAPEIGVVQSGSPAATAGLQQGDTILESNGEPVLHIGEWIEQIRSSPGIALSLLVLRGSDEIAIEIVPAAFEENGTITGRIGAEVGISSDLRERMFSVERYGPAAAFGRSIVQTRDVSLLTLRVLGRMVVGDVSLKNLSGPINIADYAGRSASYGIVSFMVFLAIVSISLGILNLLPVPVLDGGHVLFLGWEALRGAPPTPAAEAIGQRIGILLLAMLMTLAFYNDITRVLGG